MGFKETIVAVKEEFNIEDYINQEGGVPLKPAGYGNFIGLCPFHAEKTPSFNVSVEYQNYRCFGCGETGDIISFYSKIHSLSFTDSLVSLAKAKNIPIEWENDGDSGPRVDYQSLRGIAKDTANFFLKNFRGLNDTHPAVREILKRGLSRNGQVPYGYADTNNTSLYDFLKEKGWSTDLILETGFCIKYEESGKIRDKWNNRLMFFITDAMNKPIGFVGRDLGDNPKKKYINSNASPIYDKSKAIYNIAMAKGPASKDGVMFICEGQFDVISMVESGFQNTVASSGTALSKEQLLQCSRIVGPDTGSLTFIMDGDKAGKKAALKIFMDNPNIHSMSYGVEFPQGMDPCDYRIKFGSGGLASFINDKKKPFYEYILDILKPEGLDDDQIKLSQYIERSSKVISSIQNVVVKRSAAQYLSKQTGLPLSEIKATLDSNSQKREVTPKVSSEDRLSEENKVIFGEQDETVSGVLIIDSLKAGKDKWLNVSGKLISAYSYNSRTRERLLSLDEYIHDDLKLLAKEMGGMSSGRVIVEKFTQEALARFILGDGFMPDMSTMKDEEDLRSYFNQLERILKIEHTKQINRVNRK